MLGEIQGSVRFKEPLSCWTSLRIGGPADFLITPMDVDDIRRALVFAAKEVLPVVVIGGGNNILVCDEAVHGVILKLDGCLGWAEFNGEEIWAGAGVSLSALIREAAALNLGGIECLVGIPATVGGAFAENAGTPDGALRDFVTRVTFVYPNGDTGRCRINGIQAELPPGAIVTAVHIRLHRRPLAEIQRDVKQRLALKKAAMPMALASLGPIWRDLPHECARHLITKSGLKGKRLDDAEISAKHPNFIVNRGTARAADVLALMEITRERVRAQFGIELKRAIHVIGEANGTGSH